MKFEEVEAKRELIWVKVALIAPSGGGKTYSALRLASGMKQEMESIGMPTEILMANTEGSRGRYYANEFKYKIVDLPKDSDPEDYVDLINYAIDKGYKILIIDSASHEWKKALAIHQQNGGDFKAFAKVTPRHEKFTTAISDSPLHIIATIRGEDKYEVEKMDNGKMGVKKLGVGGEQRKDVEYEFTLSFLIDQKSNMAEVQKDNTHLFETRGAVQLSESDGKKLIEWANSGDGYTEPVSSKQESEKTVDQLQNEIIKMCSEMGGAKNEKLMETLKGFHPSCNPKKINDLKSLNDLKISIMNIKENN